MTHEYRIALGGSIQPRPPGVPRSSMSAIAWAADRILAVGPDATVRAISRGDSTFMALGGRIVTPRPADPAAAEAALHGVGDAETVGSALIRAGHLDADAVLEPGSPADLAFWEPADDGPRLVALLEAGMFGASDRLRGPFGPPG